MCDKIGCDQGVAYVPHCKDLTQRRSGGTMDDDASNVTQAGVRIDAKHDIASPDDETLKA